MKTNLKKWVSKEFPKNFIIKHPFYGGVMYFLFSIVFILVYNPLGFNPGRFLGYNETMLVYAIISGISVWGWINILIRLPFFSTKLPWSLGKELLTILIILFGVGIIIYFAGFFIEEPSIRWKIYVLFDSVKIAYLIGIIPFLFFTLMNVRYLMSPGELPASFHNKIDTVSEKPIQINSQLKKESLSFHPNHLIYAVSEGNYVNFHLQNGEKIQMKIIRNSISDIEKQLAPFPYFLRTHRAYIVNIKKVISARGNSLGYRLKLHGVDEEIPVSRTNTNRFTKLCKTIN
jgi:hypothetical protein